MAFINYSEKEVNCKIVYYGPEHSGKTTNLKYIQMKTRPEDRGKLISLSTEGDLTTFFDIRTVHLGTIRGMSFRTHLYTISGQVSDNANWLRVFKNVDGIVFVADSQKDRLEANLECIASLEKNLKSSGNDLLQIPYVLQLNKRDLPTALHVDELTHKLRVKNNPIFEATALSGKGVFETWKECSKLVFNKSRKRT